MLPHTNTAIYFPFLVFYFLFRQLGGWGVRLDALKKFTNPMQFLKTLTPLVITMMLQLTGSDEREQKKKKK